MHIKHIVKSGLQNMYLVKDAKSYSRVVPYAFRYINSSWEIATFDSKDEAIKAIEIAREHDGGDYLPIILETVIK